jgi:uncharacterized membrane protein YdcZ (DUF606 family)
MWPRALGVWLLASPWVLRHPAQPATIWPIDLGAGAAVVVLSVLSFVPSTGAAHLATAALGAGLALAGYFGFAGASAAALENYLVVGLLLLLVGVVPNRVNEPPPAWNNLRY